jgi:hypothetical protein
MLEAPALSPKMVTFYGEELVKLEFMEWNGEQTDFGLPPNASMFSEKPKHQQLFPIPQTCLESNARPIVGLAFPYSLKGAEIMQLLLLPIVDLGLPGHPGKDSQTGQVYN